MKKCCIFDLDGTLLNTINTIEYYGNNALSRCGLPPIGVDKYKYFVGNGAKILVKRMLDFCKCESSEIFEKVYDDYTKSYDNDVLYKTEVYDGIKETLAELKKNNIKIAVLSNKPDFAAKSVVDIFFGKGYFDVVFGQRENVPIKPDPQGVFEILDMFNLEKEDCLYIGDTGVDMSTGKSAGLFSVGVLWGFRGEEELCSAGADTIIEKPQELLKFIEN